MSAYGLPGTMGGEASFHIFVITGKGNDAAVMVSAGGNSCKAHLCLFLPFPLWR